MVQDGDDDVGLNVLSCRATVVHVFVIRLSGRCSLVLHADPHAGFCFV